MCTHRKNAEYGKKVMHTAHTHTQVSSARGLHFNWKLARLVVLFSSKSIHENSWVDVWTCTITRHVMWRRVSMIPERGSIFLAKYKVKTFHQRLESVLVRSSAVKVPFPCGISIPLTAMTHNRLASMQQEETRSRGYNLNKTCPF